MGNFFRYPRIRKIWSTWHLRRRCEKANRFLKFVPSC